ncbi:MAG: DedA family protein [Betaproteobacteria bacterium]|jgi:membrane protein YqaA with SNARE-associated domain|nr:DedA family protein [Betaproteobacteria bacterium]
MFASLQALISPEAGLAGLLAASFLAATLLPFPSEAVLWGYLQLHPEHTALALAVATLGNTAGGMTTYALGRLLPEKTLAGLDPRVLQRVRRHGAPATVLAFLPLVGEALCAAAGWLRLNWLQVMLWMAAGRLARYALVTLAS